MKNGVTFITLIFLLETPTLLTYDIGHGIRLFYAKSVPNHNEERCYFVAASPGYLGIAHLSLWADLQTTVNQTTASCWHINALES